MGAARVAETLPRAGEGLTHRGPLAEVKQGRRADRRGLRRGLGVLP